MPSEEWHLAKHCEIPQLDFGETWTCECGRQWTRQQSSYSGNTWYEIVTDTQLSDEHTSEVLEVVEEGSSTLWFRSEILHGTIDSEDTDSEMGVEVHQDGRNISLVSGVIDRDADDDVKMRSYVDIDPEDARALADALYVAADNAERDYEGETPDHEPDVSKDDSILRRFLS